MDPTISAAEPRSNPYSFLRQYWPHGAAAIGALSLAGSMLFFVPINHKIETIKSEPSISAHYSDNARLIPLQNSIKTQRALYNADLSNYERAKKSWELSTKKLSQLEQEIAHYEGKISLRRSSDGYVADALQKIDELEAQKYPSFPFYAGGILLFAIGAGALHGRSKRKKSTENP